MRTGKILVNSSGGRVYDSGFVYESADQKFGKFADRLSTVCISSLKLRVKCSITSIITVTRRSIPVANSK